MPNNIRTQTVFVTTGNPDTVNDSQTYSATSATAQGTNFAGQVGQSYDVNDREYQYVQLDSGATAATPAGLPAANEVAYWKDRSQYLVTNDSRFALFNNVANSFRNNVAGVFRSAVTPGNYCFVLQKGRAINVKEAGSATEGMILISDTSTSAAQALGVAINTAPNCMPLGVVITATAGGFCVADVDIPTIP